jgi:FKBP-type peptidyl-prolyl cis-trans isomerase FkpA
LPSCEGALIYSRNPSVAQKTASGWSKIIASLKIVARILSAALIPEVYVPGVSFSAAFSIRQMRLSLSAVALLLTTCLALAQTGTTDPSTTSSKMDAKLNELQKIDNKIGTGAEAVKGASVVVHYTGWLYAPAAADHKGAKFDSSRDRSEPFVFPLGGGRVIRGWDEGVAGMKVGGQRTLIIPPDMGYGSRGAGGVIPPNATLLFDVELLDVKR